MIADRLAAYRGNSRSFRHIFFAGIGAGFDEQRRLYDDIQNAGNLPTPMSPPSRLRHLLRRALRD
jgi:hypothetical protein